MSQSQLVLPCLLFIIYGCVAIEVPAECQAPPGNYCSDDLKGYYNCAPNQPVPTYNYFRCAANEICACFKRRQCNPNLTNICQPVFTPLPLFPSFVVMYHGEMSSSNPGGSGVAQVQGTVHQDTVGRRFFREEFVNARRAFTLIVPYEDMFRKYQRRFPNPCFPSVIDRFESFMEIDNSKFIRTSSQPTFNSDVTIETWVYKNGPHHPFAPSGSITWVIEANARTGTSKPVMFEHRVTGFKFIQSTKWTSIVTLEEHPSDAWYSYLPDKQNLIKEPIFCN